MTKRRTGSTPLSAGTRAPRGRVVRAGPAASATSASGAANWSSSSHTLAPSRPRSLPESFRVYSEQTCRTRLQNSASRGTPGDSHKCFRQGLSLWLHGESTLHRLGADPLRPDPGSAAGPTPYGSNCVEKDRPASSGRSQAILTRCSATSGGKDRRPPGPFAIAQSRDAVAAEAFDPLVQMPPLHPDQAAGGRHGGASGQEQEGACPPGQPGSYAGATPQCLQIAAVAPAATSPRAQQLRVGCKKQEGACRAARQLRRCDAAMPPDRVAASPSPPLATPDYHMGSSLNRYKAPVASSNVDCNLFPYFWGAVLSQQRAPEAVSDQ